MKENVIFCEEPGRYGPDRPGIATPLPPTGRPPGSGPGGLPRPRRAYVAAQPSLDRVEISDRKAGAIKLTPIEAAPEPRNLRRIKNEVARRWSAVPLIDILKEAILRTGCLAKVTATTGTGHMSPEVLAERLILVIYAYGTNCGIRQMISGARPQRGGPALRASSLPDPGGGPHHRGRDRQRHLHRPRHQAVGAGLNRGRL